MSEHEEALGGTGVVALDAADAAAVLERRSSIAADDWRETWLMATHLFLPLSLSSCAATSVYAPCERSMMLPLDLYIHSSSLHLSTPPHHRTLILTATQRRN